MVRKEANHAWCLDLVVCPRQKLFRSKSQIYVARLVPEVTAIDANLGIELLATQDVDKWLDIKEVNDSIAINIDFGLESLSG